PITSSFSTSSGCRCNGSPPPRRGGASRIWQASSRGRYGVRKTIRLTTENSRRRCASPLSAPAQCSASTWRSKEYLSLAATRLEGGWCALPAVEDLPVEEMWCGTRPGSRDDAPILGPGPVEGLIYATGHHRNGILLAPITADAIARLVFDGTVDAAIRPFGVERFAPVRAAE